jgi:type II secretory pathway component GspD/PulD (secretin)
LLPALLALFLHLDIARGTAVAPRSFMRLDYAPRIARSGKPEGGSFWLKFDGGVQGKIRREAGIPLFYLDILGAKIEMSPILTPFQTGPARLVRLTQLSQQPPVVRATFFLRALYAPKVQTLPDGFEVSFEKGAGPEIAADFPQRPVPFSLTAPQAADVGTDAVQLDLKKVDVAQLIKELASQVGFPVRFSTPVDRTIDVTLTAPSPWEALRQIAAKIGFQAVVDDGEIWISARENPLDVFSDTDTVQGVDLRGMALGDVLRALGQMGSLNIILDPSLSSVKERSVDLVLHKMSYRRAFETLCQSYGLSLRTIDAASLLVMTAAEAQKQFDQVVRVVPLQSDAKQMLEYLKSLLPAAESEGVSLKEDLGNLIVIGRKDAVEKVLHQVAVIERKREKAGEATLRRFFQVMNTKPEDLIKLANEALGENNRPRITRDERTDTLVVSGPRETVERAVELLAKLDKPATLQALIHIRLVDIARTDLETLGLKLNANTININDLNRPPTAVAMPAVLAFLENNNKVKTLANPTLRCMDKEEATIDISENIPVKNIVTDYLPVASASLAARTFENWTNANIGIKLGVKPLIHRDGEVTLDVNVNFTELVTLVEGHPWTATRNLKTKVRVKDRESVIIGGLIRRKKTSNKTPIPVLHRVPILKWFLKPLTHNEQNHQETEMVMIITPTIVSSSGSAADQYLDHIPLAEKTGTMSPTQAKGRIGQR